MNTLIIKLTFVTLSKCILVSSTEQPIIGILAQEFGEYDAGDGHTGDAATYIAASYVKAVESSGARVVPIFVNKPHSYYEWLLYSINGVVIPGGDAEIQQGHPYYDALTIIYKIAEQINNGRKYFPILAICLGFEAVLTLYNHHKPLQTRCNVYDESYTLDFEPKYTESYLFSHLDQETYIDLKHTALTVHNHVWCTTQRNLTKTRLSKNWKVTSSSTSSHGLKFVSTIEHKTYPFIATIFHPERVMFEWSQYYNIPHHKAAIKANQYFYDVLVKLSKLNNHKFKTEKEERDTLIYNYKPFYTSRKPQLYTQIYIFK